MLQVTNEYEQRRADQIARNRERLLALNLPALAAQVAPAKPAAPSKGLKARKKEVKQAYFWLAPAALHAFRMEQRL